MLRIKHILSILLLAVTTLVTGQNYVIDSVCVNDVVEVDAYRTYRLDGEEGSDYKWDIYNALDSALFADSVSYTIFSDEDRPVGDTTWGSEIVWMWDVVGEFDIEVTHWSEHGCDTFEIGKVKVFPKPEAEAGPDQVICSLDDIILSNDTAWNYSSFYWETTGDGTFSADNQLHPTYYLGANDSLSGTITLVLTAFGFADNETCIPAVDSVTFNFSSPDIAFTVQELLCYNDSNASITATVTDGLPPYDYSWKGPPGFVSVNSDVIDGLWAGWYVLTVTDANLCTDIDSVEIVNPPELLLTIDGVKHISCYGYYDGFISSSASGGTGVLTFSVISSSGYTINSDLAIDLLADTYRVEVMDENGCVAFDSVVLLEPDPLIAEVYPGDTTICEGDVLVLLGNAFGGNGSITHNWSGSGAGYISDTTVANPLFSSAPAGSYRLIFTITDEENCEATDSITIDVTPPSYSSDSLEVCAGELPFAWNNRLIVSHRDSIYLDTLPNANQYGCDSLLTLDVKVLFPLYQFDTLYVCANEEPFVEYIQTIIPGIDSAYLDTVQYAASGCDSLYIALQIYTLPVTDTLLDSTLCAGAAEFIWNNRMIYTAFDSVYLDTMLNSYGCDSLLTYDIKIVPPDTFHVDTTLCQDAPAYVWNGITIETYTDSIYESRMKNRYGCDSLTLLTVNILPSSDTLLELTLCAGAAEFMWNNRLIFSNQDSIYQDTLINSAGCDSLLFYDISVILPDTVYVFDTLCQNDPIYVWNGIPIQTFSDSIYQANLVNSLTCDSVVLLNIAILNGTIIDTFAEACETYTWFAGTGATYDSTGIYDYIVGGATCADTLRLHLTVSPPIVLKAAVIDVLCYGDTNGAIDLSVSGGIPPYKYDWDTGDTDQDLSNLAAGKYAVTVTDSLGCFSSLEVEVFEPDEILIVVDTIIPVAMAGDTTGSIWVSVSGGTPGYTFEWQDDFGNTIANTEDLINQQEGNYTLIVTDANNCVLRKLIPIPVETSTDLLDVIPSKVDILCFGESTGSIELLVSGGSGNYSYQWTGPDGFISEDKDISGLPAGTYSVTVSDSDDINTSKQLTVEIVQPDEIVLTISKTDVGNSLDPIGSIDIDIEGGTEPYRFEWTGPNGFNSTEQNISALAIGNYTITVTDANDCVLFDAVQIAGYGITCPEPIIIDCPDAPIPDALSSRAEYEATIGAIVSSEPLVDATFNVVDVSDGRRCPETIIRTYSIKNSNGDLISCDQLIVREDLIVPTLKIPSRTISCTQAYPNYSTLEELTRYNRRAQYNDNCEVVRLEEVKAEEVIQENCPRIIKRFYRVYDACGNPSKVAEEIIEIYDNAPPVVSRTIPDIADAGCVLPAPMTQLRDFNDAGGLVIDLCNSVRMEWIEDIPDASFPGLIHRTYRFLDACDNYTDYVRNIQLDINPVTFDQLGPYCQNVPTSDILPSTSLEGITGAWTPATIQIDRAGPTTYTFTPDAGQCAIPVIMNIEVIPEITIEAINVAHLGFSTDPIGSIEIKVEGGTGNYTFSWSNGATTQNINTLAEGDYTIYVVDDFGCEATLDVTITRDDATIVMTCPPDVTIECPTEIPPVLNYTEFVAAVGPPTSFCTIDVNSFRHIGDVSDGNTCPEIITRSYEISNSCDITDTCTHFIIIDDKIAPEIVCPADFPTGECLSSVGGTINTIAEFIAAGGKLSDNCALDSSSFTVTANFEYFDDHSVRTTTYSIQDLCGNINSCQNKFTSTDITPPVVVCNSIRVKLDSTGNYVLTDVDLLTISAGSSDNCTKPENLIVEIDVTEFTCEFVEWGKLVNVVVRDEAGNASEVCQTRIVVIEEYPPLALCRDIEVYLDENGQAQITKEMIDAGSYDNCELDRVEISKDRFDCTEVGDNIVELTAFDAYGNSSTCEATVTVHETIPPYITCIGTQTIQLDEEASFTLTWEMLTDSVSDNCAIDTVLLDKYVLDCDDLGTTFITATAVDVNGNESECVTELIVLGNIKPYAENDTAATAINMAVEINVVGNDYDLKTDIDYGSLGILVSPNHGSVKVDTTTGIVTYTPNLDYEGTDVFRYQICDDAIPCEPMCDQALVFVTVRPANLPPLAVNDSFNVPCGNLFGNVMDDNGLGADSDPDGDEIKVIPIPEVRPTNGVVILYENGNFEYEPFVDFEGMDSFQYIIYDIASVPVTPLHDTAWVYITRVADNDCDGIADIDDIDDDNDGIRDIHEGDAMYDSDNDGIPDSYDIDSDNDGIPDNIEGQGEDNYIDPEGWRDANNNGWDDRYDHEEGGYPFDLDLTDTDGDGVPDFLDIDSDDDGVFDYIEGHDENADGIADAIRIYADTDFDGLDDAYDTNPGWGNDVDNETGSSAPLQDFDDDGTRDWRDINDEDDDHLTEHEDLNGNGDFSDDDLDLDGHPEYLDIEMDCELFIPEGFSPNDDGVHDFFQILCIYPRYPDAKLMIFNRQGQKLFEKENYGNYDVWGWDDAWWWGTSENRFTLGKAGGLPAGNYVYVIELGNGEVENGTVMIAY